MKHIPRTYGFKYGSWEEREKTEPKIKMLIGEDALESPPVFIIDLEAFQTIKTFVDLCPDEISGFAMVDRTNNIFTISEPFILPQTTARGGLHVAVDPLEFNRFISDLVAKDGDPARIKFQWHSHVNSGAFFSLEDIDTIRDYLCDWMISMVINKRGEYRCRLDVFKPIYFAFETQLLVRVPQPSKETIERCQKEIDSKVRPSFLSRVGAKISGKIHGSVAVTGPLVPAEDLLDLNES